MATVTDYNRLRADVGASLAALGDTEAADIYSEAGETYTSAAGIKAATRVIAIQRILASSTRLTTYRQNNSQENLSDVSKALTGLLEYWAGKQKEAGAIEIADASTGAAVFGALRSKPRRVEEYPYA